MGVGDAIEAKQPRCESYELKSDDNENFHSIEDFQMKFSKDNASAINQKKR